MNVLLTKWCSHVAHIGGGGGEKSVLVLVAETEGKNSVGRLRRE